MCQFNQVLTRYGFNINMKIKIKLHGTSLSKVNRGLSLSYRRGTVHRVKSFIVSCLFRYTTSLERLSLPRTCLQEDVSNGLTSDRVIIVFVT